MRVLSLVPGLDPARGGTASAATNMLLATAKAGIDNVVAVPEHHGQAAAPSQTLIDLLEPAGVVVRSMPVISWPPGVAYRWGLSPAQSAWTARHIRDFDLVHVHGIWGTASIGGLIAGRIAGRPVVVTAHESLTAFDIDGSRSAARRRQKLLIKAAYLRYATMFVLTSDLEARTSLPSSVPQRTVHYPLVNDDPRAIPALCPRGQQRELRVGFLARIDPKKNLDLLIQALPRLPQHVRLIIAGSGPPELVNGLRRCAEQLRVSDRIEWLGFVDPIDRPALLANLDLLAMPSTFESFGLSAAEAMMHGVPVLVSEQTGIAELIKRHGVGGITTADISGIVDTICGLDAERARLDEMAARGQAAVRMELGFDRIGLEIQGAYQEALSAVSPPAPR